MTKNFDLTGAPVLDPTCEGCLVTALLQVTLLLTGEVICVR